MSLSLLRTVLAPGTRHVSPFLMLGDPTPEVCVALCRELVMAGASMLELGLPYADPCADGAAVQAASLRARHAGVSTEQALATLARIRAACPDTPCNLLVYGNLIHARGYQRFCRDAARAGASSLLVPDMPLEEGLALRQAASRNALGNVLLLGPRTDAERVATIAANSDAFVYLAGHQGITGAHDLAQGRAALIRRVRPHVAVPLCVGFGLSTAQQVAEVHQHGAELAVVGSHLLRVLALALQEQPDNRDHQIAMTRSAFQQLLPASRRSRRCHHARNPASELHD